MRIHRTITIAATVLVGLGIGGSTVDAGDAVAFGDTPTDIAAPSDPPPPPTTGTIVAPGGRQESTTCEGNVNCKLLEGACDLVGGTYTGWDSRDHGHTHGICTWPWE